MPKLIPLNVGELLNRCYMWHLSWVDIHPFADHCLRSPSYAINCVRALSVLHTTKRITLKLTHEARSSRLRSIGLAHRIDFPDLYMLALYAFLCCGIFFLARWNRFTFSPTYIDYGHVVDCSRFAMNELTFWMEWLWLGSRESGKR